MKRLLPLFLILVILFASAGVASADGHSLVSSPSPATPQILCPRLPAPSRLMTSEFEFLPNGYTKFHIQRAGRAGWLERQLLPGRVWRVVSERLPRLHRQGMRHRWLLPGRLVQVQRVGLVDGTFRAPTTGFWTLATAEGQAKMRFGGSADYFGVTGGFAFLKGKRRLQGP